MEGSAINAPHPDAAKDAAAFFDADEEGTSSPDPDPGDFNPETGDFSGSASDTRSDADRAEDAYQYKSGHGEPISVEEEAQHEAWIAAQVAEPELSEPEKQQAELRAIAEREAAAAQAAAPAAEASPPSAPESAGGTPGTGAAANGGGDDAGKQSGALEREYIVFQRVPLTERILKSLLKQIEDGNAPEPRVAYLELSRRTTRNDKQAVAQTYGEHKSALGDKCELAAVSSRSFKVRKVAPRQVVTSDISIS
jgi:hypothetical protein